MRYRTIRKHEELNLLVHKVVRVPEAYAHELVVSGLWRYTTKGAWKAAGRERMEKGVAAPNLVRKG